MLKKSVLMTTALVVCVSIPFAGQQIFAESRGVQHEDHGVSYHADGMNNANARFLSWFGYSVPDGASTLLYAQSASSGFAKYAIASWKNNSAYDYTTSETLAADDFIIRGTGHHTITAVYAPGVGSYQTWVNVIFYRDLRYDRKTGTTIAVVKADCPYMPFTDESGTGDLMIDVSSCNTGTFKGGHDYGISVQPESPGTVWYWQTNRKRIGRPGLWWDQGGGGTGACYMNFTPITTCYPTKGYGSDFAFAVYGH